MKKFEEPKIELIQMDEIVTRQDIESIDDETRPGGGGFGPIIG